jgi:hypothetical protein
MSGGERLLGRRTEGVLLLLNNLIILPTDDYMITRTETILRPGTPRAERHLTEEPAPSNMRVITPLMKRPP